MIRTAHTSLLAGQIPAKEITEIGLRSTAALAKAACDASDRLGTLQLGAMRSALNNYVQATSQFLAAEASTDARSATNPMERSMTYWRSLTVVMATSQLEIAKLMESSLQEMSELAETANITNEEALSATLPMAIISATSASALATAKAVCSQIEQTARHLVATAGIEGDPMTASVEHESSSQSRTRSRKAA